MKTGHGGGVKESVCWEWQKGKLEEDNGRKTLWSNSHIAEGGPSEESPWSVPFSRASLVAIRPVLYTPNSEA